MPDKEQAPIIRLRNPKTGVVIYPRMVKDSEGNWQISNPTFVKSMMQAESLPEIPDSGKE